MTQYIDKDALVTEIESKKKYAQTLGDNAVNSSMQQFYDGMKQCCVDLLSFLNTIEVKEVDLEKEYEEYAVDDPIFGNFITNDTMGMELAKHFFELGLKVSQKEERDITQQEIQDRMEVCPWREHPTENHYVCTRFSDTNVPCDGACMWVVDNLKLKELGLKAAQNK